MQIHGSQYAISSATGFPATPKQQRDREQEFQYFEQERKNNAQQPWYYSHVDDPQSNPIDPAPKRQTDRENWSIERVGGYDVVVSGHMLDSHDDHGLSWDVPAEMHRASYWQEAIENVTHIEAKFSEAVPYQGSGRIHSIGDNIHGLSLAQNEAQSSLQKVQQALERIELLNVEKALQKEYGSDVKLAYDYDSMAYVMLKPGDGRYDEVKTGKDFLKGLKHDIGADLVPKDVLNLYRKAGYV